MNKTNSLLTRITQPPGQCGGRPCIRGMRIRVSDVLEMLAENVSISEILEPTFRTFQSIFEQFYNPYSVRVSTIFVF
jgi:uncharacterized protein (DUF433 family)